MARIPYSAGDGTSSNFQPLPQGTYDCRITDVVQGTSKAGNSQLQLKLEVLDGPHTGKKVSVWYSLLPQSTWKLDLLLNALDIEREDTGEVDENGKPILDFDGDWLLERAICYDVTQREYNGKTNNNFENERKSQFDVDDQEQAEAAPTPAPAKAAPAPNTMRRRPRPQPGN